MALLSSGLTPEESRVLITALTSTPAILSGLAAVLVNLGTLIVVIRGRREIHQVKKIVNHRTDQLLEAVQLAGMAKGMEKGLTKGAEIAREDRRELLDALATPPPVKPVRGENK